MELKALSGVGTTIEWIKKNMIEPCADNISRPLTEYELRVQRALERLSIPDWYRLYSRPLRILKRSSNSTDPNISTETEEKKNQSKDLKQSEKSEVQKSSQLKAESDDRIKQDTDEAYFSACQSPEEEEEDDVTINSKTIIATDPDSAETRELQALLESLKNVKFAKASRSFIDGAYDSSTLPRVSPSRKVQNINIVFPSPPANTNNSSSTAPSDSNNSRPGRFLTTLLHDMSINEAPESEESREIIPQESNNYATLFYANLRPDGLEPCVQMHAGMDDLSDNDVDPEEWQDCEEDLNEEEEDAVDKRSSIIGSMTSLNTRFLKSEKKSRMLEKIVQRKRGSNSNSLVQTIIEELERNLVLRPNGEPSSSSSSNSDPIERPGSGCFVRSVVSALEHQQQQQQKEIEKEDRESYIYVTDSELARSMSNLSLAQDYSSAEEELNRAEYRYTSDEEKEEYESEDEGELWISVCKDESDAKPEYNTAKPMQFQPPLPPAATQVVPSAVAASTTSCCHGRQLARTSTQIVGRHSRNSSSDGRCSSSTNTFAYASRRCSPDLSPIRASSNCINLQKWQKASESCCCYGLDSGYSDRCSSTKRSSRPLYKRAAVGSTRLPGSCDSSDWEAGRSSSPASTRHSSRSPTLFSSDLESLASSPKRPRPYYATRPIYV